MQSNQENPPIWLSADSGNLSSHFAAMSASEIAQELEQILSAMTEETYDAAIIDAYLDELDCRAPSPELPSESDAWNSFQTCACVFPQGDAACCDAGQEPLRPVAHRNAPGTEKHPLHSGCFSYAAGDRAGILSNGIGLLG